MELGLATHILNEFPCDGQYPWSWDGLRVSGEGKFEVSSRSRNFRMQPVWPEKFVGGEWGRRVEMIGPGLARAKSPHRKLRPTATSHVICEILILYVLRHHWTGKLHDVSTVLARRMFVVLKIWW